MAESTSPVGSGTAGLLLMNGIPSLSGAAAGTPTVRYEPGAGLGDTLSRGWNGHGNAGEEATTPPDTGCCDPGAGTGAVAIAETLTAYLSLSEQPPFLKAK